MGVSSVTLPKLALMPDLIRLLPDYLANQIAAGEVVQRPASVVKELLENSVDAGSTHVKLIVKDAGKALVQVVDDGCGMSETDARMCFERHATSKITSVDDLFNLHTFGFRGEAMASIAAVAQVEMKTKRREDSIGTELHVEGSQVMGQTPTATPDGTNLAVKNLFYNVPARRNFLKSNPVELRHIFDEFHRVALPNPATAFSFFQNDLEVYQLRPGKLAQRIVAIFGKNYKEILLACHEEVSSVRLTGYIGKPEAAKKTRGEQFFFVNNRYIRHSYLHHAVMTAYANLLPDESFPFYVLMIEVDPQRIDVNVHPTKTEIKFDDERTIYAVVQAAVKRALGAHHLAPAIDFDLDANFMQPGRLQPEPEDRRVPPAEYESFRQYIRQKAQAEHWEVLYPTRRQGLFDQQQAQADRPELTLHSQANAHPTDQPSPPEASAPRTFQLHGRYIISQVKSGMMLVDQQAAHERIMYERYLQHLGQQQAVQRLLFPQRLKLSPADFALLLEIEPELQALGFAFEADRPAHAIVLTGVPADQPLATDVAVLEGLLEQFKDNSAQLQLNNRENVAAAMAKRMAIGWGTPLAGAEMQALIDQLFACPNPNYTPDGRKIIALVNLDTLEGLFGPM
jgi:DNA mismatch repair protein MutL